MATGSSNSIGPKRAAEGERSAHPPPERLAAYLAGRLTEQEMEALREHFAACADCARLTLDLDRFEDLQPPAGRKPVSGAEMEEAWKDLRERLGRDSDEDPPKNPG